MSTGTIVDYTYVTIPAHLEYCVQDLSRYTEIAIDTETYQNPTKASTSYGFADPFTNNVRLIQLKAKQSKSYVIDLRYFSNDEIAPLKAFLNRTDVLWVGHNIKFDYKMLKANLGVTLHNVWDSMVASQIIGHACGTTFGKARGHGLKFVAKDFLGIEVNKHEQISYWGGTLTQEQLNYAASDVQHLLELKQILHKAITDEYPAGYAMSTCMQDEMDLIPVLGDMELNGVGFDLEMFKVVQAAARAAIPSLVEKICNSFGIGIQRGFMGIQPAINLDSPKQLLEMLSSNGIEVESTEADVLEEASKLYPQLEDLMEYKKLQRALKFPYDEWMHPITKRIHPSYNQLGAGTYRLSCNDPNLQQVPKLMLRIPDKLVNPVKHNKYLDKDATTKAGKPVYLVSYRCCFVSKFGYEMIGSDFSGQELCIAAALSGDPLMCNILSQPEKLPDGSKNPDADLHSIAANGMFPEVSVSDIAAGAKDAKGMKYRDYGKILNFSTIYGKTAEGYAKDWGIPVNDARKILKGYAKKFSVLWDWLERLSNVGEQTRLSQFPENFPEARYRFLNDNGKADAGAISRASKNTPVQGTGAIMVKKSLIRLHREMRGSPCFLILTVHDEIGSEAPSDVAPEWKDRIKNSMEEVANYFLQNRVPGRADARFGPSWHETH